MLLAILAAAALAAPEAAPREAQAAAQPNTVAPATVQAPEKKKSHIVCINERPTGSHRVERICYDKDVHDQAQESLARSRDAARPTVGGFGGGPR
jgi:hypothetical protein